MLDVPGSVWRLVSPSWGLKSKTGFGWIGPSRVPPCVLWHSVTPTLCCQVRAQKGLGFMVQRFSASGAELTSLSCWHGPNRKGHGMPRLPLETCRCSCSVFQLRTPWGEKTWEEQHLGDREPRVSLCAWGSVSNYRRVGADVITHLGSPHPSPPSFDGDGPSVSQVTLQTPTTQQWDAQSPPFLPTWRRCPRVWSSWRPWWTTRWAVGRTCSEPRGRSRGRCRTCWKLCSLLLERWARGHKVTQVLERQVPPGVLRGCSSLSCSSHSSWGGGRGHVTIPRGLALVNWVQNLWFNFQDWVTLSRKLPFAPPRGTWSHTTSEANTHGQYTFKGETSLCPNFYKVPVTSLAAKHDSSIEHFKSVPLLAVCDTSDTSLHRLYQDS